MTGSPQIAFLPDGRRLHMQHGPIDLIIEAFGPAGEVRAAYRQAEARFDGLLATLVDELDLLRTPIAEITTDPAGPVAQRMAAACRPHADDFVTPMAAVAGAVADEVLVYNLPLLQPQDTKHALAFSLPIDAPGLRQICREPFDAGGRSAFDHPLGVNFEEPDSMMIFDDVLVPWDRVYVHDDVAISNAVFPDTNLRNYTAHQMAVRGLVKMQLAVGVAIAVARGAEPPSAQLSPAAPRPERLFGLDLDPLALPADLLGAARRAWSRVRAATANIGWPTYSTRSVAKTGSSWRWVGLMSFSPGISSAAMASTTPPAARTGSRSIFVIRAWDSALTPK